MPKPIWSNASTAKPRCTSAANDGRPSRRKSLPWRPTAEAIDHPDLIAVAVQPDDDRPWALRLSGGVEEVGVEAVAEGELCSHPMPSFARRSCAVALASGRPNMPASQLPEPPSFTWPVGRRGRPGGSSPSAHAIRAVRAPASSAARNEATGDAAEFHTLAGERLPPVEGVPVNPGLDFGSARRPKTASKKSMKCSTSTAVVACSPSRRCSQRFCSCPSNRDTRSADR